MRSLELCPSEGSRGRSWSTGSAGSSGSSPSPGPDTSTCCNPSQRRAATDVTQQIRRSSQRTCRRRPLDQSATKARQSSHRPSSPPAVSPQPTPQGTGQGTAHANANANTPSQTGKMMTMMRRRRHRRRCRMGMMMMMSRRRIGSPRRDGRRPQLLPLDLVALERPLLDGLHLAELAELHLDGRHLPQLLGLQGASGPADAARSSAGRRSSAGGEGERGGRGHKAATGHVHARRQGTGRQGTDACRRHSGHHRGGRRQALLVLVLGRPPGQLLLRQQGHLPVLPGPDLLRGQSRRGERPARSRHRGGRGRRRRGRVRCHYQRHFCRSCGSGRRGRIGAGGGRSSRWGGGSGRRRCSCTGRGQGQRLGRRGHAGSDRHRRPVGADQARPTGGHGLDPICGSQVKINGSMRRVCLVGHRLIGFGCGCM